MAGYDEENSPHPDWLDFDPERMNFETGQEEAAEDSQYVSDEDVAVGRDETAERREEQYGRVPDDHNK